MQAQRSRNSNVNSPPGRGEHGSTRLPHTANASGESNYRQHGGGDTKTPGGNSNQPGGGRRPNQDVPGSNVKPPTEREPPKNKPPVKKPSPPKPREPSIPGVDFSDSD